MNKQDLETLILDGNSLRTISSITKKSLTTVRYWVKKHNLKSQHKTFNEQVILEHGTHRFCPRCKEDVPIENFYQRRGKMGNSTYCKQCTTSQTLERTRKLKTQMVDYKGGKCVKCGYNKYIGALEFHHLDPTKKDYTLSHLKLNTFDDKIKNELDKCILVCSNCHREIHSEMVN